MREPRGRMRVASRAVAAAARDLRRRATLAEERLWEALRGRRLAGLKFRRQHPIGRFVADFYCPAARLVVELDGGIHSEQAERDAARTRVLEAGGRRVLRFSNDEVLYRPDRVLAAIEWAATGGAPLDARAARHPLSRVRERGPGGEGRDGGGRE